jgi:hypothetical protein
MKSCNGETEDWRRVAYQKKEAATRGVDRWHGLPFCRRAPREQCGRSGVGWTCRRAIDAATRAAGEARCDRGGAGRCLRDHVDRGETLSASSLSDEGSRVATASACGLARQWQALQWPTVGGHTGAVAWLHKSCADRVRPGSQWMSAASLLEHSTGRESCW